MKTKQGLLALAVALGAAGAAQAATVAGGNGSFEQNDFAGGGAFSFVTLGTGSTAIDGWTVTAGSVDLIDEYWEDDDGEFTLDLAGNEPGTIETTIDGLVAGTTYEISFDTAGNPAGDPAVKSATGSVGLGDELFTFDTTGATLADMNWTTQSFTFTAEADGSLTLTFSNTTPGPFGFALDNVSIAAIPLPAAGLLLLAGLGGLAALRRRKA